MMDFDDNQTESGDLSLQESRELLDEVKRATQDDAASDLHEFATLLSRVLILHEGDPSSDSEEFIASGIAEIRVVMDEGLDTSEEMDLLRELAIQNWSDRLATIPDGDGDLNPNEIGGWGEVQDEPVIDDHSELDADVVAPSADEIHSLLNVLGGASAGADANSQAPKQDQTPSDAEPRSAAAAPVATPSESQDVNVHSLDPELREAFMDDASGCVSSIEDALLQLEAEPTHGDALNQICRELHTLKGASASVGMTGLAEQLHQLEDTLRDDQEAGRAPCIDSLLKSVDSVRSQIQGDPEPGLSDVAQADPSCEQPDADSDRAGVQPTSGKAITELPSAPAAPATPTAPPSRAGSLDTASFAGGTADDESVRVKSSQLNRLMDMLAELVMLRNRRETELNQLQEIYHELIGSVSKMRLLSNEELCDDAATTSLQLSEVANDVLEVAQQVRDCARPVAEGNTAVSQFIRQFRQELVELRRTPVSDLFRRLQRVVRDAAQAEAKEVRLQLVGEDAGIERSLQQRLYEPLLHIVRNSVCHGIESSEDRVRRGKDRVGTITLEAQSGPDLFVIEIRDDGAGLDYDAIRRRGVERGLLAADHAVTREELSRLIFQPGFSTRESANQVAGRGVGMDVVASTLQRMRGWLQVDSEPGHGTRIRLSFPLPSVIQHAMVIRSSGQLFALPMQSVQTAGNSNTDSVCLSFSDLLGSASESPAEGCQRIELACDTSQGVTGRVTLLVDEIVGPEEVVLRPLPSLLKHHPFCCGATLSGMGQTVLLLDARRLVESQAEYLRSAPPLPASTDNGSASRPRILVADDSLSARMRVVRSLRRYPVEVVEASDGKQALELFKNQRFDAVFSDMEMPHVSGMELLAEINSGESDEVPPVVIISSRSEDEFTVRAKELGVHNYLIKPLADDRLDETLATMPALQHLTTNAHPPLQPCGVIQ